jgi:GNAT superfamily N-acetyltransferase
VPHTLDNIFWQVLTGSHAQFAVGSGAARRYARGFSPIVAFADIERPDFAALLPLCAADEHFYCADWSGPPVDGWRIEAESTLVRMLWDGARPTEDPAVDAIALGPQHVAQAIELAELTRPGPFGPRTIELGDYFGCFDGERLLAMAGERGHAAALREVSGVCTHPEAQGRGLARRLMLKLILRELQRGELPFLHVMRDNANARRLYERMGFRVDSEVVIRVVARI